MLGVVADFSGEDVQNDLAYDEEECAKKEMTKRPTVLECVDNQYYLHDQIDDDAYAVDDVEDDEQPDRIPGPESSPPLEREQRDSEGNRKHSKTGEAKEPDRERRAVFIKLEANETVDKQAHAKRRGESVLDRDKVRVYAASSRCHDARVENQAKDCQGDVYVEESYYFFPPDCREF